MCALSDMAHSKHWATVSRTHAIISDMNKKQEHEADIFPMIFAYNHNNKCMEKT